MRIERCRSIRGRWAACIAVVTLFAGSAAISAPATAAISCSPNHCYAISHGTTSGVPLRSAYVELWTSCLHTNTPGSDIVTHELWMGTNSQPGVNTWVEIGLIRGLAEGAPNQEFRWFWGDYRGNGTNFYQHVIGPAQVGVKVPVSVYYVGSKTWQLFRNGVNVGQSSPNGTTGTGSEAGDESSTTQPYANGTATRYQVRSAGAGIWYPAPGVVTSSTPPYHYAVNGWDLTVWTDNYCFTSASEPSKAGPTTEIQAADIAKQVARANGDPRPADGILTRSKRQAAQRILAGATVNNDPDVYVVELHGKFVGHMASPPHGAPLPRGNTLLVTISADTGEVLDWGIGDHRPGLAKLGPTKAVEV